jgi:hypothetical protein
MSDQFQTPLGAEIDLSPITEDMPYLFSKVEGSGVMFTARMLDPMDNRRFEVVLSRANVEDMVGALNDWLEKP